MNFARQKGCGPLWDWGLQSGSGSYSSGINPYQKGGVRFWGNSYGDQTGRGGTYSSGTDPYQKGGNYGGSRTVQRRRNVALSTYGKRISKRNGIQKGGSWVVALPIALQLLGSLQGGKGQQRWGNILSKAKSLVKKGTRVYKKGIKGVDKAFNSKAGQLALQLATQVANMPTVKNSKYGKYAKKGVDGLNKLKHYAAKQGGSGRGRSLRHVGQTGRGIILGKNSPFNDIPILGDIF